MRSQKKKAHVRTPEQEIVSNVPAHIIAEGRNNSRHIIDTLAETALKLAGSPDAEAKLTVIERMWSMQKDAEDRQAAREFGIAKVAVAMEMTPIPKRHKGHNGMYADRSDIESVLDPICRKHGFSKEYSTKTNERSLACQVLTVRHVGGHTESYESPYMPVDKTGNKNENQAAGSTSEYGQRYALKGAFNVIGIDVDDDGAALVEKAPDKFAERVHGDAGKPVQQPAQPKAKMTLAEAAAALEERIMASEPAKRGAVLMEYKKILAAMEADEGLKDKAAELRKLCEGKTDANTK